MDKIIIYNCNIFDNLKMFCYLLEKLNGVCWKMAVEVNFHFLKCIFFCEKYVFIIKDSYVKKMLFPTRIN